MRFMIEFRIPMVQGNAMIKNGSLDRTVRSILEDLQPQAAYCTTMEGVRGGYLVVNMDDASQIPAMVERH
jgi:hypothetical protein